MKYSHETRQQYFRRLRNGGYTTTYEQIIWYLMHHDYSAKVNDLAHALGIPRNTLVHVHVKRCPYLRYDKGHKLIYLDRQGKTCRDLGIDLDEPMENTGVQKYLIAELVTRGKSNNGKFLLTFKESIDLVREYCRHKGLPFGRYADNPNAVYEQAKKLARLFD